MRQPIITKPPEDRDCRGRRRVPIPDYRRGNNGRMPSGKPWSCRAAARLPTLTAGKKKA